MYQSKNKRFTNSSYRKNRPQAQTLPATRNGTTGSNVHTLTSSTEPTLEPRVTPDNRPNPRAQRGRPVQQGPKFPPFKWFTFFPQAQLFYAHNTEHAIALLPGFKQKALNELAIGFDIEWKPVYKKGQTENPVALIQLASSDTILLLHIHRWNWSHTSTFFAIDLIKDILHDPRIKKLGVSILGDGNKIHRDIRADIHGCIDLSTFARLIDAHPWEKPGPISLARLASAYLQLDLAKVKRITRSNWELPLNEDQKCYAANDAAVALAIFNNLKRLINVESPPSISAYEFNVINGNFSALTLAAINASLPLVPPHLRTLQSEETEELVLRTGVARL